MLKHCLRNSQLNCYREESFLSEAKRKRLPSTTSACRYIHSQREIEVLLSTLKNSPSPLALSTKLHSSPLILIPCLIPYHRAHNMTTFNLVPRAFTLAWGWGLFPQKKRGYACKQLQICQGQFDTCNFV